jgi:hypothetical protein
MNEACVACILTPETAAKYGPILDHGGFVTANVAGCLELAGDEQPDASELSCAQTVQALAGCELAACEANCAVHDAATLTEYDACAATVEAAGCQMYATAAACADSESEASALGAACLSDFATFYQFVAPYFCGRRRWRTRASPPRRMRPAARPPTPRASDLPSLGRWRKRRAWCVPPSFPFSSSRPRCWSRDARRASWIARSRPTLPPSRAPRPGRASVASARVR